MQLEKARYTARARAVGGFGLLSRLFVALFAAVMTLHRPPPCSRSNPLSPPGRLRVWPQSLRYNKLDKGGHFTAWEQPQLFAAELRAAFKSLRQANATASNR